MSRERTDRSWAQVFRLTRVTVLALLAVVALAAGTLTVQAQSATPPAGACAGTAGTATSGDQATPSAEKCVTITNRDIFFAPNMVTIPAKTDVTIMLTNEGVTMHNFSITDHKNSDLPNLNISVDVNPGETKSVVVNAEPGTYYFFCNVPGHEAAGMFGYLQVEPDAAISAESATVTPRAG